MGSNHELWVPEIPEIPNMEGPCAGRSRIEGYSTFSSSPTATSPSNAVTTRSSTWVLVGIWVTVGVPEITQSSTTSEDIHRPLELSPRGHSSPVSGSFLPRYILVHIE